LITSDEKEASQLAGYLDQQNQARQQLVQEHLEQAESLVDTSQLCLTVYHPQWSSGVIGLVAGKLLEAHQRPAIAMAAEAGQIKGSVRTGSGISAIQLLQATQEHLAHWGGHAKAAGLTLSSTSSPQAFAQAVQNYLETTGMTVSAFAQANQRQADCHIQLSEATNQLYLAIQQLAPFGMGWPTPVFSSHITVTQADMVGKLKNHLKLKLHQDGVSRTALAFSWRGGLPEVGQSYMVSYTVHQDSYQGQATTVLHLIAIQAP
jgi:single-stranded-DNA-specific exonuclease